MARGLRRHAGVRRLLPLLVFLAACAAGTPQKPAVTVRLGFFPNITHAPALVGLEQRLFEKALGPEVTLELKSFNAGPAAVEALMSGALDVTYIGPNPTLNAYARSKGAAVRVLAGACSGGAALVVRPEIATAADLLGKGVASPQLGGTQDVALRTWLTGQGYRVALQGGDVSVLPQDNAQALDAFRAGTLAGAWLPEPWASRLVREGGGRILVDERALWPEGRFVTTHLVARTEWLTANPALARKLVVAHLDALDLIAARPDEARAAANARIEKVTGKPLGVELLTAAWTGLEFTADPLARTLAVSADNAAKLGLLRPIEVPLAGLWALDPLNAALAARGRPAMSAAVP